MTSELYLGLAPISWVARPWSRSAGQAARCSEPHPSKSTATTWSKRTQTGQSIQPPDRDFDFSLDGGFPEVVNVCGKRLRKRFDKLSNRRATETLVTNNVDRLSMFAARLKCRCTALYQAAP